MSNNVNIALDNSIVAITLLEVISSAIENESILTLRMLVAVPGMVAQKELNHGLMHSVKAGSVEATRVLLEAGADVDLADSRGMTALMQASQSGHQGVVEALLLATSRVDTASASGATALHLASMHGRASIVQTLIKAGARINKQDQTQRTPLIICAVYRQLQCMKSLLAAGCDCNLQDTGGHTALHHACQKAVGVDLLLTAGADPDIVDAASNTALMVAATEGSDNVVKSLVKHHCDPDIRNSFGFAPIHYLAMKNHWRGIQCIAGVEGDLNPLDSSRKLPLWHAVNHNRHHAVKTLLRSNCHVDPQTHHETEDNIPLKTALDKGLYGLAKLLVLAGCKLQALYQWIDNYDVQKQRRESVRADRVRLFLDSDEDTDSEDDDMEEAEAYVWFQEWLHSAHSLRQLCRICLRQYIGNGLLKKADELPIPQQLRDYITLREVEDHHPPQP